MTTVLNRPALLLIDVQQAFDSVDYWGGSRNNPEAETRMAQLLSAWRTHELPVVHVKHNSVLPQSPLHPSQPGNAIKAVVQPRTNEPLFTKSVNSAFIGTDLEANLRGAGIRQVVVVGLVTDHCVSTTARMAANLGFETFVVADATATFDRTGPNGEHYPAQSVHELNLASLQSEFAQVVTTEWLLQALTSALALNPNPS